MENSLKYETSLLKKELLETPKKVSFNTTNSQLVYKPKHKPKQR